MSLSQPPSSGPPDWLRAALGVGIVGLAVWSQRRDPGDDTEGAAAAEAGGSEAAEVTAGEVLDQFRAATLSAAEEVAHILAALHADTVGVTAQIRLHVPDASAAGAGAALLGLEQRHLLSRALVAVHLHEESDTAIATQLHDYLTRPETRHLPLSQVLEEVRALDGGLMISAAGAGSFWSTLRNRNAQPPSTPPPSSPPGDESRPKATLVEWLTLMLTTYTVLTGQGTPPQAPPPPPPPGTVYVVNAAKAAAPPPFAALPDGVTISTDLIGPDGTPRATLLPPTTAGTRDTGE